MNYPGISFAGWNTIIVTHVKKLSGNVHDREVESRTNSFSLMKQNSHCRETSPFIFNLSKTKKNCTTAAIVK
jgi:hypothetical protein